MTKQATLSVEIKVRNGTMLVFRNTTCEITKQDVEEPLIGQLVLEYLGVNTGCIVSNVAGRLRGVIDLIDVAQNGDKKPRSGARTLEHDIYHSERAVDVQ